MLAYRTLVQSVKTMLAFVFAQVKEEGLHQGCTRGNLHLHILSRRHLSVGMRLTTSQWGTFAVAHYVSPPGRGTWSPSPAPPEAAHTQPALSSAHDHLGPKKPPHALPNSSTVDF